MMPNNENRRESLEVMVGRIDQRLEDLIKQFDKISNGTGFPRCGSRLERIQTLENEVKWLRNTFITTIITAIIVILVTVGFDAMKDMGKYAKFIEYNIEEGRHLSGQAKRHAEQVDKSGSENRE